MELARPLLLPSSVSRRSVSVAIAVLAWITALQLHAKGLDHFPASVQRILRRTQPLFGKATQHLWAQLGRTKARSLRAFSKVRRDAAREIVEPAAASVEQGVDVEMLLAPKANAEASQRPAVSRSAARELADRPVHNGASTTAPAPSPAPRGPWPRQFVFSPQLQQSSSAILATADVSAPSTLLEQLAVLIGMPPSLLVRLAAGLEPRAGRTAIAVRP